jgi:peptidoglycan hydrolase-like protein with peptidoglycan-binding domain
LGTTPKLKTSYPPPQACPDYLLSLRKSVVRQVQYYLIALNYIKYSDVYTFGVIGYETRKAIRDYQKMHGISQVSGTTLDNKTLSAMGISCY